MEPLNSRNGSPSSKTLLWTAHCCQKHKDIWERLCYQPQRGTRSAHTAPQHGRHPESHTPPRVTRRAGGTATHRVTAHPPQKCGFMPQFLGFTPGTGTESTQAAFSPQFSLFRFFPRSKWGDKKMNFWQHQNALKAASNAVALPHLETWGEVFKIGNNLIKVIVGVIRSWSGSNPLPTPLL